MATRLIALYPAHSSLLAGTPMIVKEVAHTIERVLDEAHPDYPHEIVGLVCVTGQAEKFAFEDDDIQVRARKTDATIVWFTRDATWPPIRNEESRTNVSDGFDRVMEYHESNLLLHSFVRGLEIQLARRVLAVGVEIKHDGEYVTKWISVPLDEITRWHGSKPENFHYEEPPIQSPNHP